MPTHFVLAEDAGLRLDAFLRARLPALSRAAVADLISEGAVRVNGRRAPKGCALQAGDRIEVELAGNLAGPEAAAAPDASLALRVLHEDAWLIAVDKPAGVPSHALRAGETGTVASALLARYPELAEVGYGKLEPGLLHRLDTETSGVLLAARTQQAFTALRALHEGGGMQKRYLALSRGSLLAPRTLHGFLDAGARRVRVSEDPSSGGKPVTTELLASAPYGVCSLVTVQVVLAGRHQVRAQLAALGHPIVGDALYGGPELPGLSRHFLHASRVVLAHPLTNKRLELEAPLPAELLAVLAALEPRIRSRSS